MMQLKSKHSYITHRQDVPHRNRIAPLITKWLYFAVLIFVILYLVYYFFNRATLVEHYAVINTEPVIIKSTHKGLVSEIVSVGSYIEKGQKIAFIKSLEECAVKNNETALARIAYQIEDAQNALTTKREIHRLKTRQLASIKPQNLNRALELTAPLRDSNSKEKLLDELAVLEIDMASIGRELQTLEDRLDTERQRKTPPLAESCFDQEVFASHSGRVIAKNVEINSRIKVGDDLVFIEPNTAKVSADVFLEYEEAKDFAIGQEFTVEFTNGLTSTARVVDITSSLDGKVSNKEQNIVPLPLMRIVLEPMSEESEEIWKQHKQVQIKVVGRKR